MNDKACIRNSTGDEAHDVTRAKERATGNEGILMATGTARGHRVEDLARRFPIEDGRRTARYAERTQTLPSLAINCLCLSVLCVPSKYILVCTVLS